MHFCIAACGIIHVIYIYIYIYIHTVQYCIVIGCNNYNVDICIENCISFSILHLLIQYCCRRINYNNGKRRYSIKNIFKLLCIHPVQCHALCVYLTYLPEEHYSWLTKAGPHMHAIESILPYTFPGSHVFI